MTTAGSGMKRENAHLAMVDLRLLMDLAYTAKISPSINRPETTLFVLSGLTLNVKPAHKGHGLMKTVFV